MAKKEISGQTMANGKTGHPAPDPISAHLNQGLISFFERV
jgi:hypothetical protein